MKGLNQISRRYILVLYKVIIYKTCSLVKLYSNRNCRLSVADWTKPLTTIAWPCTSSCNFRTTKIHLSCSWLGWSYCMEFYYESPWNGRKLNHHGCSIFSSFCWSYKKKPKTVLLFFVSIMRKRIYYFFYYNKIHW
jgi:hypothetical protein